MTKLKHAVLVVLDSVGAALCIAVMAIHTSTIRKESGASSRSFKADGSPHRAMYD